jgi:DNA-binding phage protein
MIIEKGTGVKGLVVTSWLQYCYPHLLDKEKERGYKKGMNTWHIAQTSFGLVGEDGDQIEHLSGHHCLACAYTHLVLEFGGNVDLRGLSRYGSCYQFLAVVVHNIRRDKQQKGERIMPVMTEEKKATITNHVAELAAKKGYNKSKFLAAAEHLTGISRNTLQKAYEGSTELSIETVIGLAQFFGVQFKDVLEIKL